MKPNPSVFRRPLFPFLAALYPFLALAVANRDRVQGVRDLCLPVVMSLAIAGICWTLVGFVDRTRSVRGLLALVGVVFLLWYGLFGAALRSLTGVAHGPAQVAVLAGWTASAGGVFAYILRRRPDSQLLIDYLNLAAAILLLFPLYGLLLPAGDARQVVRPSRAADPSDVAFTASREDLPDIYFIVLDKYTSGRSLAAVYKHDNGPFEEQLRGRGFVVPRSSRTNYVHTHLSLASMLNYTHLHDIAAASGFDSSDRRHTTRMIEDNRAWRFLQRRGYRFYFFGSTFYATTRNRFADVEVLARETPSLNLTTAWLLDSSFMAAIGYACSLVDCQAGERRFPYEPETFDEMLLKFERLGRVRSESGPKFVFAHVLSPHEPFLFNQDCSERQMTWPPDGDPSLFPQIRELYARQVECLNQMVWNLIDRLLRDSSRPPIVVLQGDHGNGRLVLDPVVNRVTPFPELDPVQVRERVEIFSAYHFPGPAPDIPDDITPVNVLPIIFNHYFDADIPLRDDATYWSEPWKPFRFRPVRRTEIERAFPGESQRVPDGRTTPDDVESARPERNSGGIP